MAVKIRLVRLGKIRTPHYRIVVADSKKARNGLKIEEIGRYSPASEPSLIEVNSERAQHWLKTGAQPTPAVEAILKVTGDWQKFKGIAGSEGTLKSLPARADKRAAYEAAVKAAANEPKDGATTMKKRAAEKLAAKSAPEESTPEVAPVVAEATEETSAAADVAPTEAAAETPAETPAE
ncbi:MAG: 30S ribosomal protein S16 [Actinobacteria bacterium]|nr:30S ribosomal protein S16 [Actinomycetota bacterium]NCW34467.1 30S ribosomal protein S16 [Actinomycetota bacterium]NCZ73335.1 30S ribosomal protein S16 [Actinomycetota bacterium]NDA41218.1 30S ribosomal protein S16 [Actinomycetota bacterium]NDB30863.1 30S ribosomal protein S16 [Actinomycetota bacterium]